MKEKIQEALKFINDSEFSEYIKTCHHFYSAHQVEEMEVILNDCSQLPLFVNFIKNSVILNFDVLIDICGVDYLKPIKRFEVVYHFLSVKHNLRLRVKLPVDEEQKVPSLTDIFEASNWYEREVYDMFGIEFENHPDLRRLLSDYNFTHFPLRKDFPLSGYTEVHYDLEQKKVIERPAVLPQAYRNFDFSMPWEGVQRKVYESTEFDSNALSDAGSDGQQSPVPGNDVKDGNK